jgi:GNAT superfamily N-acetyltransferase
MHSNIGNPITVIRASTAQTAEARMLLSEYYDDIGVVVRDTPESVDNFLSRPDSGLWIAYAADTPAGCVALRPLESIPSAGECKRLYVRARFRRKGIAKLLLDAMEEYASGSGLCWVYLDSKDDLEAAITLYKLRGYEPCERYNTNPQATVFLRKTLKSNL